MKHFFTSVALFVSALLGAQEPLNLTPMPSNPVTQEKCYAGILHQQLMESNPDYALKMNQFEQYVQTMKGGSFLPKAPATYVVPVVFHVIHLGEAVGTGSNVSDDVIKNAVKKLNQAYRNVNAQGGADTQIEFALAVRDPSGNCTNGITRTNLSSNNTYKNQGVSTGTGGSGIAVSTLMSTSRWTANKYYNIYIVTEIDNNNGGAGVQGFAYMATSHGLSNDGAVFMASCIQNPNDKTLIHELGHALNLYHTFEGDGSGGTCPTNTSPTTQGDRCADTPPHKRSQSDCNTSGTNSCDGGSSNTKFVYNYLDYSSDACMRLFTADQGTRMRAACSGPRASFFTSNLALVGPSAPTAGVIFPQEIYCSGTVSLLDNSTCVPNTYTGLTGFTGYSFNWSVTNGTDTKTSTAQNPTFTLTSPGWYDVTYTVTGPNGSDTKTYSNAFYYAGSSVTTCTPSFSNVGAYGINVSNVTFNTISSSTGTTQSGTYENFICSKNTSVDIGSTYPMSVTINTYGYTSHVKVYIDWNDNGTYAESELVLSGNVASSGSNQVSKVITGNVTVPTTATKDKLLRMRVIIDAQTAPSNGKANCTAQVTAGDVEDYGVMVKDDCPKAVISTQPQNVSICPNANTSFTTVVTDATSYQWEVSTNGGSTWANVTNGSGYSGATTQTLSLSNVQTSFNNYKYRLKTTNACGDGYSSVVTLTVTTGATISTQPANATICEGASNTFKVVATNATTYQWQTSTDGTTWTNVTNGAPYSGATTANLVVSNVTTSLNNRQYRCVVSSQCGSPVNTNTGTLTVKTKPTVSLPAFNTVCVYNSAFALTGGTPSGGTYSGPGVTSGSFNPTTAGVGTKTITYSVTQNGCSNSATATITVDACLGVEDIAGSDLVVYPNPTSSVINIGGNVENYQTAILVDIQGRTINSWNLEKSTQLDLSNYGNGTYFIKIIGQNNSVVTKIELIK